MSLPSRRAFQKLSRPLDVKEVLVVCPLELSPPERHQLGDLLLREEARVVERDRLVVGSRPRDRGLIFPPFLGAVAGRFICEHPVAMPQPPILRDGPIFPRLRVIIPQLRDASLNRHGQPRLLRSPGGRPRGCGGGAPSRSSS